MKYYNTDVTFQEVPDEISLCINITNCPCHCEGCHSSYLAEDIGETLDENELLSLVELHKGITCVSFMGGDKEPDKVADLAASLKFFYPNLKVAWYSGKDTLPEAYDLTNFDFVKLGPYKGNLGGLASRTTNQRFYAVKHPENALIDMTNKFWKNEN